MYIKNQEASYNFRLGFVCSKDPHFNSTYEVKVRSSLDLAVLKHPCFQIAKGAPERARGKLTAINLQRTGRMLVMIAFIVTPTIYNFPNGFFVTRKKDSSDSSSVSMLKGTFRGFEHQLKMSWG